MHQILSKQTGLHSRKSSGNTVIPYEYIQQQYPPGAISLIQTSLSLTVYMNVSITAKSRISSSILN